MKKKFIRSLAVLGALCAAVTLAPFGVSAHAEAGISIPDQTLKNTIIETLELSTNVITENDMKRLTALETPENDPAKMIKDLTGLQYAVNLQTLNLDYNKITDLTPLAELTKLESLDISYNDGTSSGTDGITDISPLKNLTALKRFSSVNNKGVTDYSVTANFTALTYLNLSLCGLENVSFVSKLNALEKGYFAFNDISDVLPLKGLTSLKTLALGNNKVMDISPLAGLTGLTQFTVENNYIEDFSPVFGMKSLSYLDISRNFVAEEQIPSLMDNILAEKFILSPVASESKKSVLFRVSEKQKTLENGQTFRLETKTVSGDALSGATFLSSDSAVATVDENGNVKAVGEGSCIVTAVKDGYAVYAEITVVQATTQPQETKKEKGCKGGCGGTLSVLPCAILACVGIATIATKKKRD